MASRDQYSDTLTRQWVGVFNGIFAEDNYTPIYIEGEADFLSVITQFPFQDEELKQVIVKVISFSVSYFSMADTSGFLFFVQRLSICPSHFFSHICVCHVFK